jgi:hypothetical protein
MQTIETNIIDYKNLFSQWIAKGKFMHNGMTYVRGVNDDTALKILIPSNKKVTGLICFLPSELTLINADLDSNIHEGFTIGKGTTMYWMMIWHKSGNVTVYSRDGLKPRWLPGDTEITVHFK